MEIISRVAVGSKSRWAGAPSFIIPCSTVLIFDLVMLLFGMTKLGLEVRKEKG